MHSAPTSRSSSRRKRVVLVDAHPIVRLGMTRLLHEQQPDLEVIGTAGTPEEALRLCSGNAPDLIVLGLAFRDGGGLDLLKRLRAGCPDTSIVVLTTHPASLHAERAFRAGANGYVSKLADTADLLRAVRKVLEGTPRVLESAGDSLPTTARRLTDREVQVLEHIGRGLRSREIAETMGLSEKTIEGYRAQLREKLNLPDAASLLQHAIQWVRVT